MPQILDCSNPGGGVYPSPPPSLVARAGRLLARRKRLSPPKRSQDALKTLQDAPKAFPWHSKTPSGYQTVGKTPKSFPRRPKTPPRRGPNGFWNWRKFKNRCKYLLHLRLRFANDSKTNLPLKFGPFETLKYSISVVFNWFWDVLRGLNTSECKICLIS